MGEKQLVKNVSWKCQLEMILERIYHHKRFLLKSVLENFQSQNLQPKIGVELEFYIQHHSLPANAELTKQFIDHLKSEISKHNINLLDIEPEQGIGQIEIKTLPYLDIIKLCDDISQIKKITQSLSQDFQINFSSQPYENDCGSALQINFSLMNENNFLFAKTHGQESKYLLHSIAAALKFTHNMMIIFAPKPEDYLRFGLELNRNLHKQKKYTAPVNIGWGYNNRSALIRVPATQTISERRLEFRLGSSSADIYLTSTFFLLAILQGIKKEDKLPSEIYGNSFDDQYDLKPLPSYEEAKSHFLNNDLTNEILFILDSNKLDYNSRDCS